MRLCKGTVRGDRQKEQITMSRMLVKLVRDFLGALDNVGIVASRPELVGLCEVRRKELEKFIAVGKKERRSRLQKAVEEEYGKSFWEVVKDFADEGESQAATAGILGFESRKAFNSLVKRHNASHWFKPPQETNGMRAMHQARRGVCTEANRKALAKAKEKNPVYLYLVVEGHKDTVSGHARRLGVPFGRLRGMASRHGGDRTAAYIHAIKRATGKVANSPEQAC